MSTESNGDLLARLRTEDSIQEALRETAVMLGNVATRMEQSEKIQERFAASMEKRDARDDDHEKRIVELERSVKMAANVVKWFCGGGFLAFLAFAYAVLKLVDPIKTFLESLHK
jgi:hypothetical protein